MKELTGKDIWLNILNILHQEKNITKSNNYSVSLSLKYEYFNDLVVYILDNKKIIRFTKTNCDLYTTLQIGSKLVFLNLYSNDLDYILSTSGKYYDLMTENELIIKEIIE